jgi:hypothetical protein
MFCVSMRVPEFRSNEREGHKGFGFTAMLRQKIPTVRGRREESALFFGRRILLLGLVSAPTPLGVGHCSLFVGRDRKFFSKA